MIYGERKYRMSTKLAVTIMAIITLAGVLAFYLEVKEKERLVAASEKALADQQNYVQSVYGQIETNLASIREHEGMLVQDISGPENTTNLLPEDRIQREINYIRSIIDQNKKLIANLNEQIDKKDSKLAQYQHSLKEIQARVDKYQQQVDQLWAENAALKNNLDQTILANNELSGKVDKLGRDLEMRDNRIGDQSRQLTEKDKAMHTAYYKVGTYRTLHDQDIVQKEGGFLGINRVKSLTNSLDNELFEEIDTREITRIPVFAKHWEVVTGQDPSSYELEVRNGKLEWLNVTDPERFWKRTKYLVIVVRDDEYTELASSR